MSNNTVLAKFADWGAAPGVSIKAENVKHHAKRAIIDWYASAIPGAVHAPATLLETALSDELDHGTSALVLGRRSLPRCAALINGTAAHAMEVDDIYKDAIYHPGAPSIAAALAAAQDGRVDTETFILAVIVGYEISTRIGAVMGRAHYRYWHNTGTIGAFGAAAAAATAYRLGAVPFMHALATVATFASGLQQAFRQGSMSKPLHAGRAAEAGLLAARAARDGVTGASAILEGDAGMGRAMSDDPSWSTAADTLGDEYHITRMTFKNHACCGHTFAAIDAAMVLRRQMDLDAQDVRKIVISTYGPALDVAGNATPATAAEARFSIPYVVATALRHGSVRLAAFTPERLDDQQTRALMKRIHLEVDPELDRNFPSQRAARVSIETNAGQMADFLQSHRKGDPELPLSDDELGQKFRELADPVLGSECAASFLELLWNLETQKDIFDVGIPS